MPKTGRNAQCGHASHAVYEEYTTLEKEVRRLKLVDECIIHIERRERPFKHEYTAISYHNGDYYQTSDTVWATVKPEARKDDEKYTLIEMPEYEEAMRRVEAASTEEIPDPPDPWW